MLLKIIIVVSTQPSITWYLKICPKFQVLSSHFSEVDELFDEHWAKKKWINQKMTILHADNCFKVARYDESYTFLFHSLIHTYSLGQGESQWVGRQGLDSSKVLKLSAQSAAPRPICRNFCALTRAYIAELSVIFFSWILSVAISRWQGFDCQDGHSTSNVLQPGVGSGARTQPQSKCASQGSAIVFRWIVENTETTGDIFRFFWRWTSILKASSHQSQEDGNHSKP